MWFYGEVGVPILLFSLEDIYKYTHTHIYVLQVVVSILSGSYISVVFYVSAHKPYIFSINVKIQTEISKI